VTLEKEILKYEKKGFKVEQKRTLKHGVRFFLKKGRLFGEGVCLYYIDGDSNLDNLRECLKDYVRFYEEQGFDASDRGLLVFTGNLEEKLFKDLRKAMISDTDVRNTIKAISLGKEIIEKEIEKEESKRKIRKATKEVDVEIPKLENVIEKIKKFSPHKMPKKEKELENMLISYLSAFYPNIRTQMTYEKARIDAQLGKIGIEIKYQPSASELNRLYGQVDGYCKHLDKVIIVIGYEKSREDIESFQQRLRERNWLNNKVFVILIR